MATDDVMAVDQRLAQLEKTVAQGFFDQGDRTERLEHRVATVEKTMSAGFHDQGQRMNRFEDRMSALESKLDIVAESIRGDLRTVLEAVSANTEAMRRTTDAIRREHEADRRLTHSILDDHSVRLRTLEHRTGET